MKLPVTSMALGTLLITLSCSGGVSEGADSDVAPIPASADAYEPLVLDSTAADGTAVVVSQSDAAVYDPDCLVTETSVAGIAFPSTLGDFVDAFPAGTVMSFYRDYMVDFGALCVRSDGANALCAIFEAYEVDSYSPDIGSFALAVYSPACRTEQGIGPASPIADVVAAYGAATFGFSYDNESREYVAFENAPEAFSFRAESAMTGEAEDYEGPGPSGSHGGDYVGVEGDGYFETSRAHPDARLWEIWVFQSRE